MPLGKEYHEMIKSDCADIANISSGGGAGSSTAAAFLEKFIDKNRPWVHLDIASVAWNKKGQNGAMCSGASGFGIKLLNQFIYDNYEKKS
jgi:leucyl aminopeptidase